jgi:thiamine transporter
MPLGGSISLEMLPIFVYALRWGAGPGVLVGALYGLTNMLPQPFVVSLPQVLLDYPVPFAMLGLAGLMNRNRWTAMAGAAVGTALRFAAHFLAGILFWSSYAEGTGYSPVMYSVVYNATYLVPELVISLIVLWVFYAGAPTLLRRQNRA